MSITSPALTILQSITSGSNTDLFSIIGGQTVSGANSDPVAALRNAESNETKGVKQQQNEPETKLDINRFLAAVTKAPDVATLLKDPTARKVLLTANGLGDQADYTALATKALLSDTTKTKNLASTLSDTRWLAVAKTFDFANTGLANLKKPAVLNTITQGYAAVRWRESLDTTTPGLSAALDFRSRASSIKSVVQILGDKNFRNVVTTALGLPLEIAYQPLEAQEKAISSRLDISKFSSASYVEQFTRRFLIANQTSTSTSSSYLA